MSKNEIEVMASSDNNTVFLTSSAEGQEWVNRALASYDPTNRMYSAYLNDTDTAPTLSQTLISSLGTNPQSDLEKIRQVNSIVRYFINTDDLIGMVVQSISNNINTKFSLSYKNFGEQKSKLKTLNKARAIIDDFNNQINIKQFIRDSVQIAYIEGNYVCSLRNNNTNWVIDYLPLGVAEITKVSEQNNPVILINISALRDALGSTVVKDKKGKAILFKDAEEQVKNSYGEAVYNAFKNKEQYARLDTAYTGTVRINNLARQYGLTPIFRALSSALMLSTYKSANESSAKSKTKKIIHQVLREKCLGNEGTNLGFEQMTFSHDQLMKAWRNNTVIITTNPAVDKIVYVEPKVDDISVDKENIERNKILSSLGVAFLTNDKSQTASTAKINLSQLLKCINSISEQVENILENFYRTVLTVNNIGIEYCPSVKIIDSELLDFDMRMDLAKLLYVTFNGSAGTALETIGIDFEDELYRRENENVNNVDKILFPRGSIYTQSGNGDNEGGRPANDDPDDPDKQIKDEIYNENGR